MPARYLWTLVTQTGSSGTTEPPEVAAGPPRQSAGPPRQSAGPSIVVLGAGYAGAAVVTRLQNRLEETTASLTWVSREPFHFVLHEGHRVIGNLAAVDALTIPVSDIAGPDTSFVRGTVTGIDTEAALVRLEDGDPVSYDYLAVAIGSDVAFYGIPGVASNAHTLDSRADALALARQAARVVDSASPGDPARVVIGGAGLSGIQIAGELADLRDKTDAPVEIQLVEAAHHVLPTEDAALARVVSERLAARNISVTVDHPVRGADEESVAVAGAGDVPYDLFVWTGGIEARRSVADSGLGPVDDRLQVEPEGSTDAGSIFLVGDAAFVDSEGRVPPTAQAAWQAGKATADTVVRSIRGQPTEPFQYSHRGTLLSVGDTAIAHGIPGVPWRTFDGRPATVLKKGAAARWIAFVSSPGRAASAWGYL